MSSVRRVGFGWAVAAWLSSLGACSEPAATTASPASAPAPSPQDDAPRDTEQAGDEVPVTAYVELASEPAGAEIFDAEGSLLGDAPMTIPRTDLPGTFTLRLADHAPREVTLPSDAPDSVRFALRPAPGARRARPVEAVPTPYEFLGVFRCDSERGPCEVDESLVGRPLDDVERRLGGRSPEVRGDRRRYGFLHHCHPRFPRLVLELRVRDERVIEAVLEPHFGAIVDCIEE